MNKPPKEVRFLKRVISRSKEVEVLLENGGELNDEQLSFLNLLYHVYSEEQRLVE